MLVRPDFEPATSGSADRRFPNLANQAAVKTDEFFPLQITTGLLADNSETQATFYVPRKYVLTFSAIF